MVFKYHQSAELSEISLPRCLTTKASVLVWTLFYGREIIAGCLELTMQEKASHSKNPLLKGIKIFVFRRIEIQFNVIIIFQCSQPVNSLNVSKNKHFDNNTVEFTYKFSYLAILLVHLVFRSQILFFPNSRQLIFSSKYFEKIKII